jgi:hypothetical protein
MTINVSTITTNTWDVVQTIISGNATVDTNSNGVYGAYPQQFIDNAGGLPMVIVHKPEVTEQRLTMTKKKFMVTIRIESFADKADTLKTLSDAVRNALETNKATTRGSNQLYHFKVVEDTEDFDLRANKRIHRNILGVSYEFVGGGDL